MRILVFLGLLLMPEACAAAPGPSPASPPPLVATVVATQTVVATKVPATARTSSPSPTNTPAPAPVPTTPVAQIIRYVAGSSQKVCQLTGETDHESNQPTASQTLSRYGLIAGDLGYSFEHDGKLFFLFADTVPSPKFNGKPNAANDPPRIADDTDAIAYSTDTNINKCVKLNFITDSIGAYKNPVVLNAQGKPAITLRENEIPIAGLSDAGKMFVIFGTDNYLYPSPDPGNVRGGFGTRTVVAESDDDANTFHYLYDFSKGPSAKFINVAIARASDGYLYFWGTEGGTLWRSSPPFLARKAIGSMNSLSGIEYLHAVNPGGAPVFMPGENDATPLFHDELPNAAGAKQEADCMGELGVEWNPYVKSWVMLYNCFNDTPANPRGIYMRFAEQPWGPWSAAQTIFNPPRNGGTCHFIHVPKACDNLSDPGRLDVVGGVYGPYFLSRFTTGDEARTTSTFYYTMATWNPYGQVIMQTTIQGSP